MLQLELPHINVLSKVDLLSHYGDLGVLLSVVSSTGTQSSHRLQSGLLHRSSGSLLLGEYFKYRISPIHGT